MAVFSRRTGYAIPTVTSTGAELSAHVTVVVVPCPERDASDAAAEESRERARPHVVQSDFESQPGKTKVVGRRRMNHFAHDAMRVKQGVPLAITP
jgi:hypothetical protein